MWSEWSCGGEFHCPACEWFDGCATEIEGCLSLGGGHAMTPSDAIGHKCVECESCEVGEWSEVWAVECIEVSL